MSNNRNDSFGDAFKGMAQDMVMGVVAKEGTRIAAGVTGEPFSYKGPRVSASTDPRREAVHTVPGAERVMAANANRYDAGPGPSFNNAGANGRHQASHYVAPAQGYVPTADQQKGAVLVNLLIEAQKGVPGARQGALDYMQANFKRADGQIALPIGSYETGIPIRGRKGETVIWHFDSGDVGTPEQLLTKLSGTLSRFALPQAAVQAPPVATITPATSAPVQPSAPAAASAVLTDVEISQKFMDAVLAATKNPSPQNMQNAVNLAAGLKRDESGNLSVPSGTRVVSSNGNDSFAFAKITAPTASGVNTPADMVAAASEFMVAAITSAAPSEADKRTALQAFGIGGSALTKAQLQGVTQPAPQAQTQALQTPGDAKVETVAVTPPPPRAQATAQAASAAKPPHTQQKIEYAELPKGHAPAEKLAQRELNQKTQAIMENLGLSTGQKPGVAVAGGPNDPHKMDGVIGPVSGPNVKKMQAALGIDQTGKVTPELLAEISKPEVFARLKSTFGALGHGAAAAPAAAPPAPPPVAPELAGAPAPRMIPQDVPPAAAPAEAPAVSRESVQRHSFLQQVAKALTLPTALNDQAIIREVENSVKGKPGVTADGQLDTAELALIAKDFNKYSNLLPSELRAATQALVKFEGVLQTTADTYEFQAAPNFSGPKPEAGRDGPR